MSHRDVMTSKEWGKPTTVSASAKCALNLPLTRQFTGDQNMGIHTRTRKTTNERPSLCRSFAEWLPLPLQAVVMTSSKLEPESKSGSLRLAGELVDFCNSPLPQPGVAIDNCDVIFN
jgi:hypothetical protein